MTTKRKTTSRPRSAYCILPGTAGARLCSDAAFSLGSAYLLPQEVANGPPEGWQLTETPGDTHMTLKKTSGSEKLQIDLMVNDQVRAESATAATAVCSLQLNFGSAYMLGAQCHHSGFSCTCSQWILVRHTKIWQQRMMKWSVDVGVQFNASVMKGEQSLV